MAVRSAALDLPSLDALAVEAYAVFVGADERPLHGLAGLLDWKLAGGLSRLIQAGHLTGAPDESLLTTTNGKVPGARLFVFGLGPGRTTPERFTAAATRAGAALEKAGLRSVAVGLPEFPGGARAALEVAVRGAAGDVVIVG